MPDPQSWSEAKETCARLGNQHFTVKSSFNYVIILVTLLTLSPPSFIPLIRNIPPPFILCVQELIIKRYWIHCGLFLSPCNYFYDHKNLPSLMDMLKRADLILPRYQPHAIKQPQSLSIFILRTGLSRREYLFIYIVEKSYSFCCNQEHEKYC